MIITTSSSWITPTRRLAIYNRDNWICVPCGLDMMDMDQNMVTLDHIVSKKTYKTWTKQQQLSFGSINKTSNLVSCCKHCNSSKKESDNYKSFGAMSRVMHAITLPIDIAAAKAMIDNHLNS